MRQRWSRKTQRAQSVLYAVLLMPMLLSVFALAIDIGGLQLERLRLHYAMDLATVTGASAVDPGYYRQHGTLRLNAPQAVMATRESLLRNITSLPDTPAADQVAAQAEVAVVNLVPARDPFTGTPLDRPSVCARIRVAHHFPLLALVGVRDWTITITSEAQIRQ